MCKVYAICNQKGGCSKTSVTLNLGVGLAMEGNRVAVIDADPQGSLTISLGYPDPDEIPLTLATVMTDIINENDFDEEYGLLHHQEGIDLLPANMELSGIEVSLANAMSREMILKEYIEMVRDRYDYILIDCITDLILETVVGTRDEILIASSRYPAEVVRSRFLKLNYSHIEYVLHCLRQNTTKVKNIRKYLLATLFNAPSTMDGYYQAEVNHDMPQYALAR